MSIVPYINTPSGAALTQQDWERAHVFKAVVDVCCLDWTPSRMAFLLQKGVHAFFEWQGVLGVDFSGVPLSRKGRATFISPIDHSKTYIDFETLLKRLTALKADFVVISLSQWHCMLPLLGEWVERFNWVLSFSPSELEKSRMDALPFAIKITHREEALGLNDGHGAMMILSDAPAMDAACGRVYSKDSSYCISDLCYAKETALLCDACECSACQQGLTRAYFHHLQAEVPFLSRRWLMVHNLLNGII